MNNEVTNMKETAYIGLSILITIILVFAIGFISYSEGKIAGFEWHRRSTRYHELHFKDSLTDPQREEYRELSKEFGR